MEIRPNRVKEKLANGDLAYVISGLTSADDIDIFGPNGFDGVWLEGEHGAVDASRIGDLTRACDLWGMTSITRVNRNDQALIYRTLDCGSMGICVPHVNTKAEAQNVVDGAKFAPIGHRGMFTSRQGYGVDNYFDVANAQTLVIVLIEDIVAVNNLDEILTVDHIDVFFRRTLRFSDFYGAYRESYPPRCPEHNRYSTRSYPSGGTRCWYLDA